MTLTAIPIEQLRKDSAIIADYQAGLPWHLIKKNHGIPGRNISLILEEYGIPLRGKWKNATVGNKFPLGDYWKDFLIVPNEVEGERERSQALKAVKVEEFNPIGSL